MELGLDFAEEVIELVVILDNSNFYIYHHDWAGENVVIQTFDFNIKKLKSLLPNVNDIDLVIQVLKDNPNLITINEQFLESSIDLQYKDL